jgi:hypothetical protein
MARHYEERDFLLFKALKSKIFEIAAPKLILKNTSFGRVKLRGATNT